MYNKNIKAISYHEEDEGGDLEAGGGTTSSSCTSQGSTCLL